ncbi:MAG: hypothetical protein ACTHU0_36975 [Kofleriaceae bacterium]
MTERQLELDWLGGAAERRLRQSRPGFDDLPWGSFDLSRLDPEDPELVASRATWTNGVFTEYASAAAFSAFNLALLECQAPIDLCAAAADFAVDELVHVALVSRLVMAMGGATPYVADLSRIAPVSSPLPPRLRAAELAIKVSCVGESLSLPALTASHRGAGHPLARAVLDRLRHDEGPHAAIGYWFLAWAEPWLTPGDRELLGRIASEAVAVYAPLWRDAPPDQTVADRDGPVGYRAYMERAVEERIVARLARHGIACSAGPAATG